MSSQRDAEHTAEMKKNEKWDVDSIQHLVNVEMYMKQFHIMCSCSSVGICSCPSFLYIQDIITNIFMESFFFCLICMCTCMNTYANRKSSRDPSTSSLGSYEGEQSTAGDLETVFWRI